MDYNYSSALYVGILSALGECLNCVLRMGLRLNVCIPTFKSLLICGMERLEWALFPAADHLP